LRAFDINAGLKGSSSGEVEHSGPKEQAGLGR
jgi:hypothetical protein